MCKLSCSLPDVAQIPSSVSSRYLFEQISEAKLEEGSGYVLGDRILYNTLFNAVLADAKTQLHKSTFWDCLKRLEGQSADDLLDELHSLSDDAPPRILLMLISRIRKGEASKLDTILHASEVEIADKMKKHADLSVAWPASMKVINSSKAPAGLFIV